MLFPTLFYLSITLFLPSRWWRCSGEAKTREVAFLRLKNHKIPAFYMYFVHLHAFPHIAFASWHNFCFLHYQFYHILFRGNSKIRASILKDQEITGARIGQAKNVLWTYISIKHFRLPNSGPCHSWSFKMLPRIWLLLAPGNRATGKCLCRTLELASHRCHQFSNFTLVQF